MKVKDLPIISVVGPTAAGKTGYALKLAQAIIDQTDATGVDLISADSRQVYQGVEILSGADIPDGFVKTETAEGCFQKDALKLWGVSMIKLIDEWSVAHFQQLAKPIIKQAQADDRAVIIVGGTGLYHDRLFEMDTKLRIPPNQEWRQKAEKMSVEQLQHELQQLNRDKFQQMNRSDQLNPRRLIRAIEIELAAAEDNRPTITQAHQHQIPIEPNHIYLGVTADLDVIQQHIKQRVEDRFSGGAIQEVSAILNNNQLTAHHPARSILGFQEISAYLNKQISAKDCQQLWSLHEFQYAKRQLTWWKNKPVVWVQPSAPINLHELSS